MSSGSSTCIFFQALLHGLLLSNRLIGILTLRNHRKNMFLKQAGPLLLKQSKLRKSPVNMMNTCYILQVLAPKHAVLILRLAPQATILAHTLAPSQQFMTSNSALRCDNILKIDARLHQKSHHGRQKETLIVGFTVKLQSSQSSLAALCTLLWRSRSLIFPATGRAPQTAHLQYMCAPFWVLPSLLDQTFDIL